MELGSGLWYLDEPLDVNGNLQPTFSNARMQGSMSPIEFVHYVNSLEYAIRNLHVELTEQGARLTTMDDVAIVINATDGGA